MGSKAAASVPVLDVRDGKVPWAKVSELYELHRCVHLKGAAEARAPRQGRWLSEVSRLERLGHAEATFCIEGGGTPSPTSRESLGGSGARLPRPWYASFVLSDAAETRACLRRCPRGGLGERDVPGVEGADACHGSHAWFFVGDNRRGAGPLRGRAEHTDALAPTVRGTWHLQLSGTKVWYVRPARAGAPATRPRKRRRGDGDGDGDGGDAAQAIVVSRGDAILVDTRAWRHRTELPVDDEVSISVARDFGDDDDGEDAGEYANVDAVVATRRLEAGDVVLSEHELPGCSLPRLEDANCAVAEAEDGTLVLVATTTIDVGDALAVAPSDSEDDDSEGDDEAGDEAGEADEDDYDALSELACIPCKA